MQSMDLCKRSSRRDAVQRILGCRNFTSTKLLDIRLFNADRHVGNILVSDSYELVPIDHGFCLPSFDSLQTRLVALASNQVPTWAGSTWLRQMHWCWARCKYFTLPWSAGGQHNSVPFVFLFSYHWRGIETDPIWYCASLSSFGRRGWAKCLWSNDFA